MSFLATKGTFLWDQEKEHVTVMELGLELRLSVKVTDLNYYYFLCYLIESVTSVVTGYNVCVFKPTVHDPSISSS